MSEEPFKTARQKRDEQRQQENEQNINVPPPKTVLEAVYGIKAGTPLIQTIETLLLANVDIEDIAEIEGIKETYDYDRVKAVADRVSAAWQKLGMAPTKEERDLERGKMIVRLRAMQREMAANDLSLSNKDKSFSARIQLEDRIKELQRLTPSKDELAAEAAEEDAFAVAFAQLDAPTIASMMALLVEAPQGSVVTPLE